MNYGESFVNFSTTEKMMTDLERLELILRRIWAKRKHDHEEGHGVLNVDTQDLLEEIADEIAISGRAQR